MVANDLYQCRTLSHRLAKLFPLLSFVPKGAGRPENAPAEVGVVANVVRAVVRAIRIAVRRGTVLVVVHPSRASRTRRNKSGKRPAHPEPLAVVHTHRHNGNAPFSRFYGKLCVHIFTSKNSFRLFRYPFGLSYQRRPLSYRRRPVSIATQ